MGHHYYALYNAGKQLFYITFQLVCRLDELYF